MTVFAVCLIRPVMVTIAYDIPDVLGLRPPPQVFHPIIGGVIIPMKDIRFTLGGRSKEGFSDEAMYVSRLPRDINPEVSAAVGDGF